MVAPGKVKRRGTHIVQKREPSKAAFHVREAASTRGWDITTLCAWLQWDGKKPLPKKRHVEQQPKSRLLLTWLMMEER